MIYSFLIDDSSEHQKTKNVVATITHNQYKDVSLDNKCLRYSMNRIQSQNHRIGTYEIKKISLSKMHILNNEYDGLALGY